MFFFFKKSLRRRKFGKTEVFIVILSSENQFGRIKKGRENFENVLKLPP